MVVERIMNRIGFVRKNKLYEIDTNFGKVFYILGDRVPLIRRRNYKKMTKYIFWEINDSGRVVFAGDSITINKLRGLK